MFSAFLFLLHYINILYDLCNHQGPINYNFFRLSIEENVQDNNPFI